MTLSLQAIEIETAPRPDTSIIVLHGLGADGNDFVPFASELDLASVGPVRFVFPHSPTRPVTVNGGYVMPAWYDIGHGGLDRHEDEAGMRESQRAVQALIARERSRGIEASRIVLAGFSQGCAMALLIGLRQDEGLAGIAGLSGYLPLSTQTADERHPSNQSTPIFLAHGRQDGVVPIDRGQAARQTLTELGYGVEWHDYPMPHSVCPEEVADLNEWLLKILAR